MVFSEGNVLIIDNLVRKALLLYPHEFYEIQMKFREHQDTCEWLLESQSPILRTVLQISIKTWQDALK